MEKNLRRWLWGLVALGGVLLFGLIGGITNYELNFFVFYFLPVSLVAWFMGRGAAVSLGVLSAMVWFGADVLSGHRHSSHFYAVWDTMVRLASFLAIGWSVSKIRQLLDRERKLTGDLRQSLSHVKVLEAFLPICSRCKKIRDQEGSWQQMEVYISEHTNTRFSHGYCPECAKRVVVEAGLIKEKNRPDRT
jgi:hypothetical protein